MACICLPVSRRCCPERQSFLTQIELYATPGSKYEFLFIAKVQPLTPCDDASLSPSSHQHPGWIVCLRVCANGVQGGGSANKTYLYQQTKALLNPTSLMKFLEDNIKTMCVSPCARWAPSPFYPPHSSTSSF
jgi:hypothetical protein